MVDPICHIRMGGKPEWSAVLPEDNGASRLQKAMATHKSHGILKLAGPLVKTEMNMSRYGQMHRAGFPGRVDSSVSQIASAKN